MVGCMDKTRNSTFRLALHPQRKHQRSQYEIIRQISTLSRTRFRPALHQPPPRIDSSAAFTSLYSIFRQFSPD